MFSLTPKLFIFLLVHFLIVPFFTLIFQYSNSHHITPSSSKLCTLLVIMNGRYCFINECLFFIILVLITVNQKLLMVLWPNIIPALCVADCSQYQPQWLLKCFDFSYFKVYTVPFTMTSIFWYLLNILLISTSSYFL